jgi:hypothetical protein
MIGLVLVPFCYEGNWTPLVWWTSCGGSKYGIFSTGYNV